MYVYAERYISGYEFSPDAERLIFHEVVNAAGLQNVSDSHSPSVTVRTTTSQVGKAPSAQNAGTQLPNPAKRKRHTWPPH